MLDYFFQPSILMCVFVEAFLPDGSICRQKLPTDTISSRFGIQPLLLLSLLVLLLLFPARVILLALTIGLFHKTRDDVPSIRHPLLPVLFGISKVFGRGNTKDATILQFLCQRNDVKVKESNLPANKVTETELQQTENG